MWRHSRSCTHTHTCLPSHANAMTKYGLLLGVPLQCLGPTPNEVHVWHSAFLCRLIVTVKQRICVMIKMNVCNACTMCYTQNKSCTMLVLCLIVVAIHVQWAMLSLEWCYWSNLRFRLALSTCVAYAFISRQMLVQCLTIWMISVQRAMPRLEWCNESNPGLRVDPSTCIIYLLWAYWTDFMLGLRVHFYDTIAQKLLHCPYLFFTYLLLVIVDCVLILPSSIQT